MKMKIWLDDTRLAPEGYLHCKSVNEVKTAIRFYERNFNDDAILIDLDCDSGDYFNDGRNYIRILDWIEKEGIVDTGYSFRFHTADSIGAENMKRIIKKNKWKEI